MSTQHPHRIEDKSEQTAAAPPQQQRTRAAQEAHAEAERLMVQIDAALQAVANSRDEGQDLDTCADRLERYARDLSVALRELARERRLAAKDTAA